MGRRADPLIAASQPQQGNFAGVQYLIQTPTGVLYAIVADEDNDIAFKKSTDGGLSWTYNTVIFVGTATALSVWYDRWSNISAGLIHLAYTESVTDDTLYRTIDTENSDALSTQTTIFAGASTAAGGHLSITRAVGGNVYCKTVIDAGAEGGFYRLPNANVPSGAWDAARTVDETIATTDQMILLPDYDAADTQDIMAIFWDASANEISRKLYDDSANSWSETSIATSMTDTAASSSWPHFAVAMDIANTKHWLAAWSAVNTLNADLRVFHVDASTITEVTNVVTNSPNNQGMAGITLDPTTGMLTVYYCGKSDGTETYTTAFNIYCKQSTDGGTTWGPETKLTTITKRIDFLYSLPRVLYRTSAIPPIMYGHFGTWESLLINIDIIQPHARFQLGF